MQTYTDHATDTAVNITTVRPVSNNSANTNAESSTPISTPKPTLLGDGNVVIGKF